VCEREREKRRCRIEYRKRDVEYNRKSDKEYKCVTERERKRDGEYNTEKDMYNTEKEM